MAKRAVAIDNGVISVPICAIQDLIEMKIGTGRFKYEEDIRYLQGLLENNEN